jgi:ATP-binding cassette, subfamily B, bacterial
VSADEAPGEVPAPITIYDCQPDPAAKVDLRRLPKLSAHALRIAWSAGRGELVASVLLQLVGGGGIAVMLLLGQRGLEALLTAVNEQASVRSVLPWILAIAGVSAVQFFASTVQRERQEILGELVRRYVEQRVLDVAATADLVAFETPAFHNRIERIRMSSHQALSLVWGLSSLIRAVIGVVGVLVALLAIEPLVIPLVVVVFLPAWLVASRRGEAFYRYFWRMTPRDRERQYLASLLADRDPAKEVRSFGLAAYLRRRHDELYEERIAELRRVARRQLIFSLLANLGIAAVLATTLLFVGWLTLQGGVPVTAAGMAVAGVAIVGERLTSAGYAAGSLAEAGLYLDDYLAFLKLLPQLARARPTAAAPARFHQVEVDGVSFTYPSAEEPALKDVSLTVRAGEVVALVGENGSGKTTLAKLLAGLYQPETGQVRWDGVDIATVDPEQLRRSIAVIFQDFVRFHLTARDNVAFGRVEAADDEPGIRAAARQAGAEEFLAALPKGYGTLLGPQFEGGTDLSVGQWQRVALARAFFREAPFVVLDEPTAALDSRAEHELFERIRTLLAGRTVLLISHRFSSVRTADRIYVLEAGRVVETGTHEELMRSRGLYAELFSLQAAAYLAG